MLLSWSRLPPRTVLFRNYWRLSREDVLQDRHKIEQVGPLKNPESAIAPDRFSRLSHTNHSLLIAT